MCLLVLSLYYFTINMFCLDAFDKIDFSDMTLFDNLYFPNNVILEIRRTEQISGF